VVGGGICNGHLYILLRHQTRLLLTNSDIAAVLVSTSNLSPSLETKLTLPLYSSVVFSVFDLKEEERVSQIPKDGRCGF
jgi:hypothetical protein